MRKVTLSLLSLLLLMLFAVSAQAAEHYRPFVLGSISEGTDINAKANEVKQALISQGFRVLGEYDINPDARVIVVTNDDLLKLAKSHKRAAYIAPWRVAVAKDKKGRIQVSYANPYYLKHAYHIKGSIEPVANKLKLALGWEKDFGSKKGLTAKDLEGYHYTFGMEYFDEPYELKEYKSHAEAVKAVEEGLKAGKGGLSKVYRLDIPGTDVTVFGVAMDGKKGGNRQMDDNFQMQVVDFQDLRTVAYFPYELAVIGNKVEAPHMRFRMAIHHPDLKMFGEHSFKKLMSSPAAIEDAFWKLLGGREQEELF